MKKKIVHIHTDYKFIWSSLRDYEGEFFDNWVVIVENKTPYDGPIKENTYLLNFKNKKQIITQFNDICNDADLVVLNNLNILSSKIATLLPQNIKIAWRFFGAELYGKRLDLFTSEKTRAQLFEYRYALLQSVFQPLKSIYHWIKYGIHPYIFNSALKRIDYFLALSKEEYDFLSARWSNLPEFINLPYKNWVGDIKSAEKNINSNKSEQLSVILGVSRNLFNNHLDIIEMIERNPNKLKYKFILLFNYGKNGAYAQAVRKKIMHKTNYKVIDDFIHKEEFTNFYRNISALVINGFRQMGGGNIWLAMIHGVKVYLNEKNIHFKFLINEGFQVFTMKDFENDLRHDNLFLTYAQAKHNLKQLLMLSKKYNVIDFQKRLYARLSKENLLTHS